MEFLNYHHLNYFRVIANAGGISKASRILRVSQSALSTQLKSLEESIGCALFQRRGKEMILTETGKRTLQYANEIFRLGDELMLSSRDRPELRKQSIRIGVCANIPKSIAFSLVQKAHKIASCKVTLVEGSADDLLRELSGHELDLMLSNVPPYLGDKRHFSFRSLNSFPVVVCGAEKYRHLAKGFPDSLEGQPFVLPLAATRLRHEIDYFFEKRRILINEVLETEDTSIQKSMALSGSALIPIARPAIEKLAKTGKLYELGTLEGVTDQVWLIAADKLVENKIAAELMKSFGI